MAAEATLNPVTEERCSRLSLFSTPANEESADSSLIQDSTCATRKRKETDSSRNETVKQKRRKPAVKAMPKKKRQEMLKSVGSVQLNSFQVEVRKAVEEQFADSNFCAFISELFKEEEPIMQILRQHRDSFVLLYSECKQQKNSFMRFQLQWHYHCSAFLLEEKFTLASINLDESVHASLVAARNVWLEFCKKHNSPVPETNPVMMAISSTAYSYLLNQVSIYQANLVEQTSLGAAEVTSVGDGDDVYYRFGGAAICAMLKHRYKELKSCLRTDRNALSIQICMLQAMNLKDKSCIPDYLKHRDQGYMYFPHHSLIPFLRNLDTVVKETVNEDGFCKHGDDLIKVCF